MKRIHVANTKQSRTTASMYDNAERRNQPHKFDSTVELSPQLFELECRFSPHKSALLIDLARLTAVLDTIVVRRIPGASERAATLQRLAAEQGGSRREP